MAIGVQSTHGACERDGHGERYPLLPRLPSPEGWPGEDFQAPITSRSTETGNQATPTLRAPTRRPVQAHQVGALATGDNMVAASELLDGSRASAAGVICGCADRIASYDILGRHQVPYWKPVVPTFTLLFTFMRLTSFQVLNEHSCRHAAAILSRHYARFASPPNHLTTASSPSPRGLPCWPFTWHGAVSLAFQLIP